MLAAKSHKADRQKDITDMRPLHIEVEVGKSTDSQVSVPTRVTAKK